MAPSPGNRRTMRQLAEENRQLRSRVAELEATASTQNLAGAPSMPKHRDSARLRLAQAAIQSLHEADQRFHACLDNMLDCFAILSSIRDDSGRIIDFRYDYINPAGCRMSGLSAEAYVGRTLLDLLPGMRNSDRFDAYCQVVETGEPLDRESLEFEGEFDGRHLSVALDIRAWKLGDGIAVAWRDITRRKQAEEALRLANETLEERVKSRTAELHDSHVKYRALFKIHPDAIFLAYADGRIIAANPAACALFGMTEEEICRAGRAGLVDQSDPRLAALLEQRARTGKVSGELTFVRKDGTKFIGEIHSLVMNGEESRAFVTIRDITLRKQVERTVQQELAFVRQIIDADPNLVFVKDETGRFLLVNQAMADLYETSADQLVNRLNAEVLTRGEDYEQYHRIDQLVLETRQPVTVEETHKRPDGRILWLLTTKVPIRLLDGRRSVLGVAVDITERKAIEEALKVAKAGAEDAKATAEAASKAKDQFLAVLSHELRNPLNPVLATASLLQQDGRLDDDVREQLDIIHRNAELEAMLIDDLLDVTRIERGKIEMDLHPVELLTILHRAAEVCRPDIEARKLQFGIDTPDGPYPVNGDAARLQQVFWNLLKNAIKFTPVGGRVGIHCRRDDTGMAVVEVHDTGEGIEPEALARIFKPFEQAERSITRQFGGLGLGLTISKALVELHGGSIQAHSEGKGKGATFTVRLPLLPAETAVANAAPASALPVSNAPARPLRILLVEDHADTARVMRRILSASGHKVQIAVDVATALKLADEQAFDLLLSDLGLPDGTGLDLMRALRKRHIRVPAIALTGFGQEKDIEQTRQAGFVSHLVKPVDLGRLREVIEQVASKAHGHHLH